MDMVVNAFIAAIAKHGIAAKPGLNVYNIGSSTVNPIASKDVIKFCCDHFTSFPLMDSQGRNIRVTEFKFFSSMDNFSSYISDEIAQGVGLMDAKISDSILKSKLEMKCKKRAELIVDMAKLYKPYAFFRAR